MVVGPEIARITTKFGKYITKQQCEPDDSRHQEQQPTVQEAFLKEMQALVTVLGEMGNPFLKHSQDLLVIDTRETVDNQLADTVRKISVLGEEQYS